MRLSELKNKLKMRIPEQERFNVKSANNDALGRSNIVFQNQIDNLKIIGITGSRGKSAVAVIVYEYLKSLGYKTMLYSSVKIESPASFAAKNEACESALRNENMLLGMIEEAEIYGAEYLVLEVNESAIHRGLTQDIPFTVRALTNIFRHHNDEIYTPEEYVNLKKSFFRNIPDNESCVSVFGMTGDFTSNDFNELLFLNNKPKVTYGSQYLCESKGVDYTKVDCLLNVLEHNLTGLNLRMRIGNEWCNLKTKLILPHNALNIACATGILKALNVLDAHQFNKCIDNITVLGRDQIIKAKGRTIIIGMCLNPHLEVLAQYKRCGEINNIKVLTGAVGRGFISWDEQFKAERFTSRLSEFRRFAINCIKKSSDYVYLTSDDNAAEDPEAIANEMQRYLNNEIQSEIITDRKEALKKAVSELKEGELLYIAGRGNKRTHCDTASTIQLFTDLEIVEEVIKENNW